MLAAETAKSNDRIALTEFLNRYPWPEDWARRGSIQNYLYTYELDTTPEKLWP